MRAELLDALLADGLEAGRERTREQFGSCTRIYPRLKWLATTGTRDPHAMPQVVADIGG